VFERIVIGVDESPESLVAVRQAGRLLEPNGRFVLTAVADVTLAVRAGWGTTQVLEDIKSKARTALSAACAEAPGAEAVFDLLVVGSRGVHGMAALGSVSVRVAHRAGCSVLVIREDDAGR